MRWNIDFFFKKKFPIFPILHVTGKKKSRDQPLMRWKYRIERCGRDGKNIKIIIKIPHRRPKKFPLISLIIRITPSLKFRDILTISQSL